MILSSPHGPRRRTSIAGRAIGALFLLSLYPSAAWAVQGGVGDKVLERPPYYAGKAAPTEAACIAHLPIAYQRGAEQDPIFEPEGGPESAIGRLLDEMNAQLDSLAVTSPIRAAVPPPGRPPDVRFGCDPDAAGDCEPDEMHDPRKPKLLLAVDRPSGPWTAWLGPALDSTGASHALVVTLEVGQYWVRQRNLRGNKDILLGTNHTDSIPWITSLEMPVSVLQLTGALVGPNGRAVRIGAEGMLARRTGIVATGFGLQALITVEDVERLRASHREDLAERPLVWQAALVSLVTGLTGREPGSSACPADAAAGE